MILAVLYYTRLHCWVILMADSINAIVQMAVLLIVVLVGYAATKLGYLDMRVKDKITALLLNITLPCMIIASAGDLDASSLGSQVIVALVLGVVAFFLWVLVAGLFIVCFRVPAHQRSLYYFMSVCSNTSFIGIPVADALYGESAALLCSVFIMATSTLMYSVGIALLVGGGKSVAESQDSSLGSSAEQNNQVSAEISQTEEEKSIPQKHDKRLWDRTKTVLRAAASPLTFSALLALVLVFSDFTLPAVLQDSMELIGSITPPVAMMLVGVIIANEKIRSVVREWRLYPYIIIRQFLASAGAYLALRLFISDPVLLGIFCVMCAMPVGSMAPMFCASYGKDALLPAKGTILSTIASFLIVPGLVLFISFV